MGENLFEKIKKINSEGKEFWSARELYSLLGYSKWENFFTAIDRAKESCKNSGQIIKDHFPDARKSINSGKNTNRDFEDFHLSRYACYLIAQNGDPRKVEIAKAQTYFAIKTRQREIEEQLIEDQKRIAIRGKVTEENKKLASTAKRAGVNNFANFQDFGYMGLYGGLRQNEIKKRKGLNEKENLLDNIGSEELIANLFRASQADSMIKRESIMGEDRANQTHKYVGQKVRNTIKTLGGTMPEDLPKVEHISKVRKKLKDKTKNKLIEN
jgi:DNA-damage-inducible protein D